MVTISLLLMIYFPTISGEVVVPKDERNRFRQLPAKDHDISFADFFLPFFWPVNFPFTFSSQRDISQQVHKGSLWPFIS